MKVKAVAKASKKAVAVVKRSIKPFAYIVAFIVIISGIVCGIGVYKEITSKSYINGELGVENVFTMTNFNYQTNGLTFYADDLNDFTHTATLVPTEDFDGTKKHYEIYLNGYEILTYSVDAGLIEFNQAIQFLDVDKQVINDAVLNVRLEFYADKTKLKVAVKTESEAFLNQYFNLNGFNLEIREITKGEINEEK